ncbi:hypothetical protein ACFPYJ_27445 [Paenibacillus solisilvae]|uniref:Uncharacterized protein n=1 Tax=Paenibacillus solisilvae TaxID=2486751 RepID=A0ABW0W5L6_9BACL
MLEYVNAENKSWLDEVWGKLQTKMTAECGRIGDRIPYVPVDGVY